MTLTKNEEIWANCIKPKIDRMKTADDDIFFIDGQVKEKIWLTYESCKNNIHTYMYDPDGRIDRHKVASIMLYSIIINKPFELKYLHDKESIKSISLMANEILGFNTAVGTVLSFIDTDAVEKSDNKRIEIFKNGFIYPKCQHDSYEANVFKMLYYAKYNERYDIFAFSHVLFLIEAYTELVRKTELAGMVLK
jgi:hypothetical protein